MKSSEDDWPDVNGADGGVLNDELGAVLAGLTFQ